MKYINHLLLLVIIITSFPEAGALTLLDSNYTQQKVLIISRTATTIQVKEGKIETLECDTNVADIKIINNKAIYAISTIPENSETSTRSTVLKIHTSEEKIIYIPVVITNSYITENYQVFLYSQ